MESSKPHSANKQTHNTIHTQGTDTDSSLSPIFNDPNDSYSEPLVLEIDDDEDPTIEDLLLLDGNPSTGDDTNMSTLDEDYTIQTPRTEEILNPHPSWLDSQDSSNSSPPHKQIHSPEPTIYTESNKQCTPTTHNTHSEPIKEQNPTTLANTAQTGDIQPPVHQADNPHGSLEHMGSPTKQLHTPLSSNTTRCNEQKPPVKTPAHTKPHNETKHEPTIQGHNHNTTTTDQPTDQDSNNHQVNKGTEANKAHAHRNPAPRHNKDFPSKTYTYEELVSRLRILTNKYKLHYEYAEAMKLRVQHREPPQNLFITKHSPFPLPPHFQSHWNKILRNTSNDLCNLIRKHHEEERDILEEKINHLTSCLRLTATKDQMKQYMQLKLTVNPTATTQHGPIDDAIQDIYKQHNFEHSTMLHQQDTDTTCTPTKPHTRHPHQHEVHTGTQPRNKYTQANHTIKQQSTR